MNHSAGVRGQGRTLMTGLKEHPMFVLWRIVYSTVAGALLAVMLLIAVELFSSVVHPFPPEFGGTKDEICQHVARYPQWVLAVVLPMWLGLAFVSTWIAVRLGRLIPGLIVGGLLIAALTCNALMLPYPVWFSAGIFLGVPSVVALGLWSLRRRVSDR
ncbi:MAG: hypothetical protein JSS49_05945 [Planctomycetes bacterium]|nr:hypothetical protein [Planctomycetota bacterium]